MGEQLQAIATVLVAGQSGDLRSDVFQCGKWAQHRRK